VPSQTGKSQRKAAASGGGVLVLSRSASPKGLPPRIVDSGSLPTVKRWRRCAVGDNTSLAFSRPHRRRPLNPSADEQLIEVLFAAPSRMENGPVVEEAEEVFEISFEFLLGEHVIRRIPDYAVKSRRAFLDPILVLDLSVSANEAEEYFGELDLPMKETKVWALGQSLDLGDQVPLGVIVQRGIEALPIGQVQVFAVLDQVRGLREAEVLGDQ
jgi:hypothetical protein